MNSLGIFPSLAKLSARPKVRLLKNMQQYLIVGCITIMSWTYQVQAQSPTNANNPPANAPAAATSPAAPPAPTALPRAITSDGFDKSKVPPVTTMSRPGQFILPPGGAGHYSLWDMVTGNKREKPPVAPYAPFALLTTPAYEIDFRYLDKTGAEKNFFDPVKRMHLGDDWLLSFGGNFWYRYTHETDSRLNTADTNNDFHLLRTRVHADLWYRDKVRLFAELLDARAFGSELPPLVTDRNHADMLNLFTDIKLATVKDGPVYIRVGRQELLYGSQRLISTLDWVNTRRTFQGVKAFWRTPSWDIDAFWVRPMITEKGNVDNWDTKQNFFGLWGTNRIAPTHALDLYFLSLENDRNLTAANVLRGNILQGDSHVHTLGGRLVGNFDNYLYELEGMYQFGRRSNMDVSAFAVAAGAGYRIPTLMNAQGWIRYDFASGDSNSTDGRSNTFNQLFPFGHYYMGYLDRVGRQNVHDFNVQFTMHPVPWITFITQYHRFYLANQRDYLYNASGFATFRDVTGQSGSHIGDEIDFRFNIHVDRHQDVLFGYSKLFSGDFLKNQVPGVSADLLYVQYNFRF
jgi:hypothetical protein